MVTVVELWNYGFIPLYWQQLSPTCHALISSLSGSLYFEVLTGVLVLLPVCLAQEYVQHTPVDVMVNEKVISNYNFDIQ